jgi:hypothetical protein
LRISGRESWTLLLKWNGLGETYNSGLTNVKWQAKSAEVRRNPKETQNSNGVSSFDEKKHFHLIALL